MTKLVSLLLLAVTGVAHAQTVADTAAIRQAALDYIEGWYSGDAERMERAVHPELAKRIVQTDARNGRSTLGQQSAATLVQNTRGGGGKETPEARRLRGVTILDVYENAATVRVDASDWVDYMHLARRNEREDRERVVGAATARGMKCQLRTSRHRAIDWRG
jgi:hypothetical protein